VAAPDHASALQPTPNLEKRMNTKLMNKAGLRTHALSLAVAAATGAIAGTASAEEWQWSATPYVWATDLGIGLSVADRDLVDHEIAFDDLMEKVDAAAMVRVEGMRGQHGMAFDLFNVELADTQSIEPPGAPGADLALDAAIGLTILDATGVYDPRGDGKGFSLVYGARVIEQRNDIAATLSYAGTTLGSKSIDTTDRFVDGLVGFRYVRELPRNFSYGFAADVSTGDTELTWSAGPSIGYAFGDRHQYRVTAGYRRMDVDFETAEPVDADMSMSGLLIGFRVDF
jgi:hypothetical protein